MCVEANVRDSAGGPAEEQAGRPLRHQPLPHGGGGGQDGGGGGGQQDREVGGEDVEAAGGEGQTGLPPHPLPPPPGDPAESQAGRPLRAQPRLRGGGGGQDGGEGEGGVGGK